MEKSHRAALLARKSELYMQRSHGNTPQSCSVGETVRTIHEAQQWKNIAERLCWRECPNCTCSVGMETHTMPNLLAGHSLLYMQRSRGNIPELLYLVRRSELYMQRSSGKTPRSCSVGERVRTVQAALP